MKYIYLVLTILSGILTSLYSIYISFKYLYESEISLWINHFNEVVWILPCVFCTIIFYYLYKHFEYK